MKLQAFFDRFKRQTTDTRAQPLSLYNTLGKEKQVFSLPSTANTVRMYNCGPTVYDVSHIGNLRSYIFADLVRRTLFYNGYRVKQVINITDFGHLSSDADAGQDKMTKALKREKLALTMENMRALAERYTEKFIEDLGALNVETASIAFPRASDHVKGEIALVRTLEEKAYTYEGEDGVYYDTSRFPEYGKLGDIDLEGLKSGARVPAAEEKRNVSDFLLWKKDKKLGWDSPWGKGFPGWHIECSAMINATLGKQIDIHTGGIDLIPTHHNNEIAQSEAATGKRPFSRFWMHNEFLNISNEKISKSLGNMINLDEVIKKGFHPLAYRYYLLGAHYRTAMNFTWESLDAAQTAFLKLRAFVDQHPTDGTVIEGYRARMHERINDDVDTAGALAVLWEMIKDDTHSPADIRATILDIDTVLGLNLSNKDSRAESFYSALFGKVVTADAIPAEVQELVDRRNDARTRKAWDEADSLRKEVEILGYSIDDAPEGTRILKRS